MTERILSFLSWFSSTFKGEKEIFRQEYKAATLIRATNDCNGNKGWGSVEECLELHCQQAFMSAALSIPGILSRL